MKIKRTKKLMKNQNEIHMMNQNEMHEKAHASINPISRGEGTKQMQSR